MSGIAAGAEVNVQADWNAVAGDALILNKPTSISGYGITDAYTKTEIDLALGGKADDATTLAGYNITDAYTKTESDNTFESKNANIQSHISSTANPHGVTAAQVGAYTTAQTDTLLNGKISKVTSTDNAIARFDGVTGQPQNSGVTIDDTNNISLPANVLLTGTGARIQADFSSATASNRTMFQTSTANSNTTIS